MINLDYLAAKYGQQIGLDAKVEEKTLSTALNILHEQGIYALFLWLYQKADERRTLGVGIQNLFKDKYCPKQLENNESIWSNNKKDALDTVRSVFTIDLRTMFIAKDLISLTLTYARHAAKTRSGEEN
ncbi:MAG: hypothetical protein GX117_05335 [Candidatus Hydrogenedentes bacterium]|jgi:hypothetical protein|nr:hypothetical protein [Candidatus Hydrogenedentota bacterium]